MQKLNYTQNNKVVSIVFLAISLSVFLLWVILGCSTSTQPEKFGAIFVESSIPGAKIILDNVPQGKQTPDTLFNVKVGSHLVEVEMEGYLPSPSSRMIKVEADTTVEASFTLLNLSYGSLSVNSNVQGAFIAIDNVPTVQQTPFLFDQSVTAGPHIVSVFKQGYSNDVPAKEVLTISAADTVELNFHLTPTTIGGKEVGNITPDFYLEDDFGEQHRLYAYRGFVCMINFWALSCYFCMVELPYLQNLYSEYSSDSLKIFAVNYEDDFDIIEQKRNELGLTFFLLKGLGSTVKDDFDVTGTPVTIILDRSGKIYYYRLGFSDQPDKIQQQMSIFRQNLNELFGR